MDLSRSDDLILDAAWRMSLNKLARDAKGRFSESRLAEEVSDAANTNEPYSTVLIVLSAQGIIDNGGLCAFLEADWPHSPPYDLFTVRCRKIGATASAQAITSAIDWLGLEEPHLEQAKRDALLDDFRDDETGTHLLHKLGASIYDDDVWQKLVDFIKDNSDYFDQQI